MRQYQSQREMLEDFTDRNDCVACYTGIRANTEKPPYWLVRDALNRL